MEAINKKCEVCCAECGEGITNMRVLLAQPNYQHARQSRGGTWSVNPPIGLAYIAALLEQRNIPVEILDANALNLTEADVVAHVHANNPDIVGVSLLTPAHTYATNIVQAINNECLTVAGGPHATALPEQLLKDGFDVVVRGEGEYTMLDLALQKNLTEILGISYKKGEKIHHNENRLFIQNVDDLPFPARHLLIKNGMDVPYSSIGTRYHPWSPILTSRGCPYQCYFCNKNIFGSKFRTRSPQNVVDEIEYLVNTYGVKEIDIYDDIWNVDLPRAEKILDLIINRKLNIYIRCSNGIHVAKVTKPFLEKFKKAGGEYVAYGIESGVQEVLDKIPKHITLEQVKHAVLIAREVGLEITGFFIFGLIGDTPETMQKTIEFAKGLDLDIAVFNVLAPYPGTKLYEKIQKEGKLLLADYDDFHHTTDRGIFIHPEVPSPEEVGNAYKRAHKEFYFRPRYLLKQLTRVRSWSQLCEMYHGGKAVLSIKHQK